MNKVKIAQIGVGYWGPNLLRNLSNNKNCEVEMVVDLSEERRSFVENYYPSTKVSDNFNDVINNVYTFRPTDDERQNNDFQRINEIFNQFDPIKEIIRPPF